MLRKSDETRLLAQLGSRIREQRRAAGLTQDEMSERTGIDYKRYQRIEAGNANVTVRTLMRISKALGLTFWQLCQEPPKRRK